MTVIVLQAGATGWGFQVGRLYWLRTIRQTREEEQAEHRAYRTRAEAAEATLKAVREAWERGAACGLDDSTDVRPTTPRAAIVRLLAAASEQPAP